ncbi:MAG: DHH family phosphoesterase [Solirubrobacteraceae bacterium]
MPENGRSSSREQVLEELRRAQKFVAVTHENPDGDALGSLVAMTHVLSSLGKDCLPFIDQRDLPLPREYAFLATEGLLDAPPEDLEERTIVFLDCGNLERNAAKALRHPGMRTVNIDHHHDNTLFGTVNLVEPGASCTAEIVWDLMQGLGVEPTRKIAEALYVGLITDTGRFMYENTSSRAHRMAAELIESGVEAHTVYRQVYENVPYGKLALLARGLAKVERYDSGRLTVTELSAEDFAAADAAESYSEGVIDHLRAVQGTSVAALVRDRISAEGEPERKVSLRSSDERIDVSRIARVKGGGGHPQAAGFATKMGWNELMDFLRSEIAAQIAAD